MKWFKHECDASEGEFLQELEDLFGLEGYARWFKILEKIAEKMDETRNCSASYSWRDWQSILKGKQNKLETFLKHCENKNKMILEQNGNILKITCNNLLKKRDNHTKNLQANQKKLATKNQDTESDLKDKDSLKKGFDIKNMISEVDLECAKSEAPGWDIYYLAGIYNNFITKNETPKYPGKAFIVWCKNFTKGKPP